MPSIKNYPTTSEINYQKGKKVELRYRYTIWRTVATKWDTSTIIDGSNRLYNYIESHTFSQDKQIQAKNCTINIVNPYNIFSNNVMSKQNLINDVYYRLFAEENKIQIEHGIYDNNGDLNWYKVFTGIIKTVSEENDSGINKLIVTCYDMMIRFKDYGHIEVLFRPNLIPSGSSTSYVWSASNLPEPTLEQMINIQKDSEGNDYPKYMCYRTPNGNLYQYQITFFAGGQIIKGGYTILSFERGEIVLNEPLPSGTPAYWKGYRYDMTTNQADTRINELASKVGFSISEIEYLEPTDISLPIMRYTNHDRKDPADILQDIKQYVAPNYDIRCNNEGKLVAFFAFQNNNFTNLLRNYNFENGTNGWTLQNGATISTSTPLNGANCLQSGGVAGDAAYSYKIYVKAGIHIRFEGYIKSNNSNMGKIQLKEYNSSDALLNTTTLQANNSTYALVQGGIKLNNNTQYIRIYCNAASTNTVRWDDIAIFGGKDDQVTFNGTNWVNLGVELIGNVQVYDNENTYNIATYDEFGNLSAGDFEIDYLNGKIKLTSPSNIGSTDVKNIDYYYGDYELILKSRFNETIDSSNLRTKVIAYGLKPFNPDQIKRQIISATCDVQNLAYGDFTPTPGVEGGYFEDWFGHLMYLNNGNITLGAYFGAMWDNNAYPQMLDGPVTTQILDSDDFNRIDLGIWQIRDATSTSGNGTWTIEGNKLNQSSTTKSNTNITRLHKFLYTPTILQYEIDIEFVSGTTIWWYFAAAGQRSVFAGGANDRFGGYALKQTSSTMSLEKFTPTKLAADNLIQADGDISIDKDQKTSGKATTVWSDATKGVTAGNTYQYKIIATVDASSSTTQFTFDIYRDAQLIATVTDNMQLDSYLINNIFRITCLRTDNTHAHFDNWKITKTGIARDRLDLLQFDFGCPIENLTTTKVTGGSLGVGTYTFAVSKVVGGQVRITTRVTQQLTQTDINNNLKSIRLDWDGEVWSNPSRWSGMPSSYNIYQRSSGNNGDETYITNVVFDQATYNAAKTYTVLGTEITTVIKVPNHITYNIKRIDVAGAGFPPMDGVSWTEAHWTAIIEASRNGTDWWPITQELEFTNINDGQWNTFEEKDFGPDFNIRYLRVSGVYPAEKEITTINSSFFSSSMDRHWHRGYFLNEVRVYGQPTPTDTDLPSEDMDIIKATATATKEFTDKYGTKIEVLPIDGKLDNEFEVQNRATNMLSELLRISNTGEVEILYSPWMNIFDCPFIKRSNRIPQDYKVMFLESLSFAKGGRVSASLTNYGVYIEKMPQKVTVFDEGTTNSPGSGEYITISAPYYFVYKVTGTIRTVGNNPFIITAFFLDTPDKYGEKAYRVYYIPPTIGNDGYTLDTLIGVNIRVDYGKVYTKTLAGAIYNHIYIKALTVL